METQPKKVVKITSKTTPADAPCLTPQQWMVLLRGPPKHDVRKFGTDWSQALTRGDPDGLRTLFLQLSLTLGSLQEEPPARPFPARLVDIFASLHACSMRLRVVIVGAGPALQGSRSSTASTGLAFDWRGKGKAPRHMDHIFRAAAAANTRAAGRREEDDGDNTATGSKAASQPPGTSRLMAWGASGVLVLPSALTMTAGSPLGHAAAWAPFVDRVLQHATRSKSSIAFVAWGEAGSHTLARHAPLPERHRIIECSAPGVDNTKPLGLVAANDFLRSARRNPVHW